MARVDDPGCRSRSPPLVVVVCAGLAVDDRYTRSQVVVCGTGFWPCVWQCEEELGAANFERVYTTLKSCLGTADEDAAVESECEEPSLLRAIVVQRLCPICMVMNARVSLLHCDAQGYKRSWVLRGPS